MHNKINTEFLHSLIKFDFFFSYSKELPNFSQPYLKTAKISLFGSFKHSMLFTPEFLLKEFKQFIRVIQFLKKQSIKISIINFKDILFTDAFKLLCLKKGLLSNFFIEVNKNKRNADFIKICFFSFQKFSAAFYKKFYNSLNYISIEFLFYLKKNDFGAYSTLITINNWKKLVFLFLIFNSIYKK